MNKLSLDQLKVQSFVTTHAKAVGQTRHFRGGAELSAPGNCHTHEFPGCGGSDPGTHDCHTNLITCIVEETFQPHCETMEGCEHTMPHVCGPTAPPNFC